MRLNTDRARALVSAAMILLTLAAFTAVPPVRAADAASTRPAARQSPDWLRDAVVYEVFPRAFSQEGNFKGVISQLDRLKELGVTVLWLMPIHPVGKLKAKGTLGSPYAVRDYDAINPEYGNGDDLKRLVAAAHQRGMKVFIDIVANHTAWDSVLIGKHPDWYTHDAAGRIVPPNPDWVDVADLDYSSPALREYMSDMLVRWLRDYGLDGFRLRLRERRADATSGKPCARSSTAYARASRFWPNPMTPRCCASAFDIDYAWDFYHAMSDALAGATPASTVREVWERAEAKYPRGALRLRFSDNHDQLRTTGQAGLPAALAASAVMFTLDGVPLLYNGMEVGDTTESAAPALFERAPHRLGNGRAPPAGDALLPGAGGAAARAPGVYARRGALAAQRRRTAGAELRTRGRRRVARGRRQPVVAALRGHRRSAGRVSTGKSRRYCQPPPRCRRHNRIRRAWRSCRVWYWRPGNSGFSGG